MPRMFALLLMVSWPLAAARAQVVQRAPEITGSYVLRRSNGAGCELQAAPVAVDSGRVQLSCSRGGPSFNLGFLDEQLPLNAGTLVFRTTAFSGLCEIRVQFRWQTAQVTQRGDAAACGFGFGVDASGSYTRASRRLPPFNLSPNG